jgi:hypothetical protein
MNGDMYIIYEGFENDVAEIFKPLIEKFHFKIENISDYGITFINNNCRLKFFREVSLIVWYYNREKYKRGILLTQYFYDKDKKQYEQLNNLYFKKISKEYFVELCSFLIEYFSDELKENLSASADL